MVKNKPPCIWSINRGVCTDDLAQDGVFTKIFSDYNFIDVSNLGNPSLKNDLSFGEDIWTETEQELLDFQQNPINAFTAGYTGDTCDCAPGQGEETYQCIIDNCTPLNDFHSIGSDSGPGFLFLLPGATINTDYPHADLATLKDDLLYNRLPDFSLVAGSPAIDAGTFPDEFLPDVQALALQGNDTAEIYWSEYWDTFQSVKTLIGIQNEQLLYDGARPDMGAIEHDFPPPDPTGVSGTRLTNPTGSIQLNWYNYVVAGNKDHGGWQFDLKNYVLSKTGDAYDVTVDRLHNEFTDYSASPGGFLHLRFVHGRLPRQPIVLHG